LFNRQFKLIYVCGKAGFDIGGHGNIHDPRNAFNGREHFRPRQMLAVGVTEGIGDGGVLVAIAEGSVRDDRGAGGVQALIKTRDYLRGEVPEDEKLFVPASWVGPGVRDFSRAGE